MYKLSLVNKLCRDVISGEIDITGAIDRLERIAGEKSYPDWYDLITYPVISFTICLICFGGWWIDGLAAGLLGFVVGGISVFSSRFDFASFLLCQVGFRWACY